MIAIIYEGAKTEPSIFRNIINNFFDNKAMEIPVDAAYGGNIHDLANALKNDLDLDIISVVKERIKNSNQVNKYSDFLSKSKDDFSEIYLFFDCDPHHMYKGNPNPMLCLERNLTHISELLELFDNETENGKLYINYPMAEALKDIQQSNICYHNCVEDIENLTNYKSKIGKRARSFCDVRRYTYQDWGYFARHAISKANCLVKGRYVIPEYEMLKLLSQSSIFDKQEEFILQERKIYILSSFSLFLLEYFGKKCWAKDGLLNISNAED